MCDLTRSFNYYEQAANRGHLKSKLRVAKCYQYGSTGNGQPDLEKALGWYHAIVDNADETTQTSNEFQEALQLREALEKELTEQSSNSS